MHNQVFIECLAADVQYRIKLMVKFNQFWKKNEVGKLILIIIHGNGNSYTYYG